MTFNLCGSFLGTIEPAEVKAALETLGVIIDLHEAEELTLQYVQNICVE